MDFGEKLTIFERNLLRGLAGVILLILSYGIISIFLNNAMIEKENEIMAATDTVNSQIALINQDTDTIKTSTSKYNSMTERLVSLSEELAEKNRRKNAIPVLMNQIMFCIPKGVQITSIENTSGNKIVINAQASTYDQLGYLKVSIRDDGILKDVVSDNGVKQSQNGLITTTIEGTLPIE